MHELPFLHWFLSLLLCFSLQAVLALRWYKSWHLMTMLVKQQSTYKQLGVDDINKKWVSTCQVFRSYIMYTWLTFPLSYYSHALSDLVSTFHMNIIKGKVYVHLSACVIYCMCTYTLYMHMYFIFYLGKVWFINHQSNAKLHKGRTKQEEDSFQLSSYQKLTLCDHW